MSMPTEAEAADRFAQAVAAFRKVQDLILTTHRKLRSAPQQDRSRFWAGTGAKLEQHQRTCATALVAAYQEFARTRGVAGAGDRRLVNEAYQVIRGVSDRREGLPPHR
jgi:hypothetical protein